MFEHSVLDGRTGDDRLKRHRWQIRNDGHQLLRHTSCLREIRDNRSREVSQRRNGFGDVAVAGSLEIEKDWYQSSAAELISYGFQNWFSLLVEPAEDQNGFLADRLDDVPDSPVVEEQVKKLGDLEAVCHHYVLLWRSNDEVALSCVIENDVPSRYSVDLAPRQVGAPKVRIYRDSQAQISARERRVLKIGASQISAFQVSARKICPNQPSTIEIGAGEIRFDQPRIREYCLCEIGSSKGRLRKICAAQVRSREICPAKVGQPKVRAAQVGAAQASLSEVSPAEIGSNMLVFCTPPVPD